MYINIMPAVKTKLRQGSPLWLEKRQTLLGGSEIGQMLHSRNWSNMIKRKLSNEVWDNKYMRWGRLFEPVALELFEKELGVHVYDSNAYYVDEAKRLGYSPDGKN